MLLTSPQNTRIRQLTALIGKARQRKKTGLFTVEGARIVREVPDDLLEELYVSESFEAGNGDFLSGKRYFTLTDEGVNILTALNEEWETISKSINKITRL